MNAAMEPLEVGIATDVQQQQESPTPLIPAAPADNHYPQHQRQTRGLFRRCVQSCCQELYKDYVGLGWFGFVLPINERILLDGDPMLHPPDYVNEMGSLALQRTFGPWNAGFVLIKTIFFGWGLSVLIQSVQMNHKLFWLAYLTHWTLCLAIAYQFYSLCMTLASAWLNYYATLVPPFLFSIQASCQHDDEHQERLAVVDDLPATVSNHDDVIRPASMLVKVFWILFALTITAQTNVAILFWFIEYDPTHYSLTYQTCMVHGGLCALIWMDGLAINRIPIRLRHIWVPIAYSILYTAWTLIHDYVLRGRTALGGNPDRFSSGDDNDDDAIYYSFSWNHRPLASLMLFGESLLLLNPGVYLLLWMISRAMVQRCPTPATTTHGMVHRHRRQEEDGVELMESAIL